MFAFGWAGNLVVILRLLCEQERTIRWWEIFPPMVCVEWRS
jgi:hypothetical protein